MNARKLVMILVLTMIAGGIGASRGLAYMRGSYNGACGQLGGFPGLLQKMNFFEQGDCRVKKGHTDQCEDEDECTIKSASGHKRGRCKNLKSGCTCVVDRDDEK